MESLVFDQEARVRGSFCWLAVAGLVFATAGRGWCAAGDGVAETVSLAGKWEFRLDPKGEGVNGEWFREGKLDDEIELPGTTDEQKKGAENTKREVGRLTRVYPYVGAAWYGREVEVPAEWAGKHVTLTLERTKTTTLWVDGKRVGSENWLATSQVYDVSGMMGPGKHWVVVCVDNKNLPPVGDPHQVSDQTQTNWNGVIGKVELEARDTVWMQDVRVTPDVVGRKVGVTVTFGGMGNGPVTGELQVWCGLEGGRPADAVTSGPVDFRAGPEGTMEVDVPMGEAMRTWDEFSPALYKLTVQYRGKAGGEADEDRREVEFGMRDFKARGTQFAINGKTLFVRGKHDACVFPLTGYPPMEEAGWEKVFGIAKSYGINLYRFHTWCPPEAAFEAADKVGMYLQPELPVWGSIGAAEKADKGDVEQHAAGGAVDERTAYLTEQGKRMLREYGNHPSFVMLSLGNEMSGSREVMGEMVKKFREFDGGRRLFAQGSNNFFTAPSQAAGDDFWTTTMTGGHYKAGVYEKDALDKLVRGSTAVSTVGFVNNDLPGTEVDYSAALKGIGVPVIGHEVGQYETYPDFAEIPKFTGVVRAYNLETFQERLKKAGMLDQAEDFVRASGALAVICYRADIEAALRTKGFGGFDLLDLQDYPGQGSALVGILDAFMDSKGLIAPEKWREFCCETVPLVRFKKYTWTDDETFEGDVEVANYGPGTIKGVTPRWVLAESGGKEVARGELATQDIAQGKLVEVGKISAALQGVAGPEELTLTVELPGTAYRNSYSLWVYPADVKAVVPGDVTVARGFDEAAKEALERGGKVLVLADAGALKESVAGAFTTDFWSYPMFKKYHPPGTMGILVDPKHPAFAEFPTEFHSDWQWWRLTKHGRPMVLDGLPRELRPVVQVIDNFERNHKLGLLWEARVGKGKLMVCSMDMGEDAPEVRQFYASLLGYMGSEKFSPQVEVGIGEVEKIVGDER